MEETNKLSYFILSILIVVCSCSTKQPDIIIKNDLRAPAYPIITIDPYTNAWSTTDNLYDGHIKHWTGTDFPLTGAIRVDGETYRFLGVSRNETEQIAGVSSDQYWSGKYTFKQPAQDWTGLNFNDSLWEKGQAAFGTSDQANINTLWETRDIWVRRYVDIPDDLLTKKMMIEYSHDDQFELYINGIKVIQTENETGKSKREVLPDNIVKTLKSKGNIIAAHCTNFRGGGLADFGLYYYHDDSTIALMDKSAVQKSVDVQATQTRYKFECGNIELNVSFIAPLLMDNIELIARPVNYIAYNVESLDGKNHDVQIYFEASPDWARNIKTQSTKSDGYHGKGDLLFVKTGTSDQNILGKSGDDLRIDWGYFYLCSPQKDATSAVGDAIALRTDFIQKGMLNNDMAIKDNANIAIAQDLGKSKSASGKIMVGYDDIYSIQYFENNLRPYWNKDGNKTIEQVFADADNEFTSLVSKCNKFDLDLMQQADRVGGKEYAELCALAYRQAISAHKLVNSPDGKLLFLSKENNSNGSIGTVDVTYPSIPLFLYYNTDLAKSLLNFIFDYCENGKWKEPFPPHDLGTYPLANGQTYNDEMPVEESGNMLILTAAITAIDGNADYAIKHWEMLTKWMEYLSDNGLDPDNQLCTDDFAGHLAHNANLSIKAIMGIASYGYIAGVAGRHEISQKYIEKARSLAHQWMAMANDGDHYRLTFDRPDTWSQKYNLVWDKLLQLNIFPKEVTETEIAYYLTKQNEYGLPLDSRANYTKADWIVWTATLSNDQSTFRRFILPLHKFMNETVDRVPMSDWYNTDQKTHRAMIARSVVGGFYIKMLEDKLLTRNRNK